MRMSHVYQPLMLLELLGRSSPAPAQDVARRILGEDVTQIDYYTERVKRMVGKVLTGNGITTYANGAYTLIGAAELSDAERDEAIKAGYDLSKILTTNDLVRGNDVFFAATGVTDGELLRGVRYDSYGARSHSLVMRSRSGTIRYIDTHHRHDRLTAYFSTTDS